MKSKSFSFFYAVILAAALSAVAFAQEQTRPAKTRPAQKPAADTTEKPAAEKPAVEEPEESPDEKMRRVMTGLNDQIGLLTDEVRRLRQETQRNSDTMQLLLYEERLARVEEKIEQALDHKFSLEAREQDIQRRTRNIQQELVLRGAIRRDEAEAAIRAELQRALESNREEQAAYQQRIAELQTQATRLRARVEALRAKVERQEEKEPKQDQ
jgi:chromosome segregation ATPase